MESQIVEVARSNVGKRLNLLLRSICAFEPKKRFADQFLALVYGVQGPTDGTEKFAEVAKRLTELIHAVDAATTLLHERGMPEEIWTGHAELLKNAFRNLLTNQSSGWAALSQTITSEMVSVTAYWGASIPDSDPVVDSGVLADVQAVLDSMVALSGDMQTPPRIRLLLRDLTTLLKDGLARYVSEGGKAFSDVFLRYVDAVQYRRVELTEVNEDLLKPIRKGWAALEAATKPLRDLNSLLGVVDRVRDSLATLAPPSDG